MEKRVRINNLYITLYDDNSVSIILNNSGIYWQIFPFDVDVEVLENVIASTVKEESNYIYEIYSNRWNRWIETVLNKGEFHFANHDFHWQNEDEDEDEYDPKYDVFDDDFFQL